MSDTCNSKEDWRGVLKVCEQLCVSEKSYLHFLFQMISQMISFSIELEL
jgi:hypothetical protein